MAIPIAEIPNAPSAGPGPVGVSVPQANTDISQSARALMQPTLDANAFSGPAQGLQAIAQGVGHLGEAGSKAVAAVADWQAQKMRLQDEVSLAQYDKHMTLAYQAYKESLPGMSEAEYLSGWEKRASKEREAALKTLSLSQLGMKKLELYDIDLSKRTTLELMSTANTSAVQRSAGEILSRAQREFQAGNTAGAKKTLQMALDLGIITPAQMDSLNKERDHITNTNTLDGFMKTSPLKFAQDMDALIKGGPDLHPGLVAMGEQFFQGPDRHLQMQRWAQQAKTYLYGERSQQRNEVFSLIHARKITTESQIQDLYNKGGQILESEDLQAARNALVNSVCPLRVKKYNDVRHRVMTANPKADPDGTILAGLKREIGSELPTAEAQLLAKQLDANYAGRNINRDADAYAAQVSQNYYDTGVFGKFHSGEAAKHLTGKALENNIAAENKAAIARAQFDDAYNAHSAKNYQGMTVDDADDWVKGRKLDNKIVRKTAEPVKKEEVGWGDWIKSFGSPSPLGAEETRKFIDQKRPKYDGPNDATLNINDLMAPKPTGASNSAAESLKGRA